MKIVLAPDKFKASLTGADFCRIVSGVLKGAKPDLEITELPLADGGDGTAEVLEARLGAERMEVNVSDPLFRPLQADYLFEPKSKLAFIEMAKASGFALLNPSERNPMNTSSYGTGELIRDALQKGAERIVLGIGGSATNDAGIGLAAALGYRFVDAQGVALSPVGRNLAQIHQIIRPENDLVDGVQIELACDVSNPFYGKEGAAYVYGPQKGASEQEVEYLDQGLQHLAALIKSDFGLEVQAVPGAGAAGGIGGGAIAFLGAKHRAGIELVKDLLDFDNQIKGADWIISGEGALDEQSLYGKTIKGVCDSAAALSIPVAVFCGHLGLTPEKQKEVGIAYATSINKPGQSLEEAIASTSENLKDAVEQFAKESILEG